MIQKYLGIGLILFLILFSVYAGGYHQGEQKATKEYLPQIQQLKDAIDTADKEARQKQSEYKENNDEIQRQNDQRVNNIRDYYKRLLQSMPSQNNPGSSPSGSQATDGTSCQSTITGCPASIEENCALDANKVKSWQEWAIKNKIPVSVD